MKSILKIPEDFQPVIFCKTHQHKAKKKKKNKVKKHLHKCKSKVTSQAKSKSRICDDKSASELQDSKRLVRQRPPSMKAIESWQSSDRLKNYRRKQVVRLLEIKEDAVASHSNEKVRRNNSRKHAGKKISTKTVEKKKTDSLEVRSATCTMLLLQL